MESGSITISASEIALHLLLLPILGRFHKQYPGVRLRLLNHSTPEAVESVKNGLADFAVVTTPLQAKKPLKSTSLMSFKEIAVGDHSFQEKEKPMRLKDLIENPLISLGQGSTTYEFYSKFFLENDLVLSPDYEWTGHWIPSGAVRKTSDRGRKGLSDSTKGEYSGERNLSG